MSKKLKHTPKVVNCRLVEKTTAELYYYCDFDFYGGLIEYSYLQFYGTRSDELREELKLFMDIVEREARDIWDMEHKQEIKDIEQELITTVDGWFNKPSQKVKKKLKDKNNEEYLGVGGFFKCIKYKEFLQKYNIVKISSGKHSTIYEILPEYHA